MAKSIHISCVTLITCLLICVAGADAPLPPPADVNVCSYNGEYCVTSLVEGDTTVRRRSDPKTSWRIRGWRRWISVSNNGTVALSFDGGLLPRKYDPNAVLLETWKDGKLLRRFRLPDLVRDRRNLRKTVSHYYWGIVEGFTPDNELMVSTVERDRIVLNPETGEQR